VAARSASRALLAAALVAGGAGAAHAADNDLALVRLLFDDQGHADQSLGQHRFGKLVRELGMAMAPKLVAPAETLGLNGFDFDLELSATNINEQNDYWKKGVVDETPPGTLLTNQLRVRKGLPYSFELGAVATYLDNSEMWAFGGEVKWAPNEAVEAFPVDVAIRAGVNRILGESDLDMTVMDFDFVLSRGFGVAGVANVAPYMAYEPVFVYARSKVLDATPADPTDSDNSFVFSEESPVLHRFVLGARFVFSPICLTPEVVLTRGLQTYNVTFGTDF
jgi:hypothetical protein